MSIGRPLRRRSDARTVSAAEDSWTSWLWLPVEFLLAVVGLTLLLDPALWATAELLGVPGATEYAQIASFGFAIVVAPLFVGDLLSLSRLWDYALVLLASLACAGLLALAAAVALDASGARTDPSVLAPLVALAYLATFFVVYVRGVRL